MHVPLKVKVETNIGSDETRDYVETSAMRWLTLASGRYE
jgi:hypothetical protein